MKREEGLNVLLVTLDTTRADRLGAYGYDKARTPALDALAKNGVRFANAYCEVPMTLPSHCSILTGTGPLYHKVHNNGTYYLNKDIVTLTERLKAKGYATAAFVSSFNVDSRFGVGKGFDVFDDRFRDDEMMKTFRSERRAGETTAAFLRWLDGRGDGPFFSWIHYYDPHTPYKPPSPFREQLAPTRTTARSPTWTSASGRSWRGSAKRTCSSGRSSWSPPTTARPLESGGSWVMAFSSTTSR